MDLPVNPPVKPMLAKAVPGIPERDDLIFEPKWDGFRCIVFRDGDEVHLGSRNEKPLTRYFPELIDPVLAMFPDRCVVDCELIVSTDNKLDFGALQQRIHPAESRVNKLAAETPAELVAFDLLAIGDEDLREEPFHVRRARLESVMTKLEAPLHLTATTTDHDVAEEWFVVFEGAGLDGLIAKPRDEPYVEDKRTQLKVKHVRTADAVVAGFRMHKDGEGVGSLLLGLYGPEGDLRHVGVAASFTKKRRVELRDELMPLRETDISNHPWGEWGNAEAHVDGQMPGAPHRWSGTKDSSWIPLRIERVAEVKYNATLGGRLREVARFLRWRPDKEPSQCDFDQLDEPVPAGLDIVLNAEG